MSKLILATGNEHKVEEIRALLAPLGSIEILSQLDFPNFPDVEESADTFQGNAIIKARACAEYTGELSLADDSGIVVDALNGRPGVLSARYAPTSEERNRKLLDELRGVPDEQRTARYVAVAALVWPDGKCVVREGTCEGRIAHAPRGDGGFGYDPIFWLPDRQRMMAEISEMEKNAISHRGAAFRAMIPELEKAL